MLSFPINWPSGVDGHYIGVYYRIKKQVELFDNDNSHGSKILKSTTGDLNDPAIKGSHRRGQLSDTAR